jgi:hypothetical protein
MSNPFVTPQEVMSDCPHLTRHKRGVNSDLQGTVGRRNFQRGAIFAIGILWVATVIQHPSEKKKRVRRTPMGFRVAPGETIAADRSWFSVTGGRCV